jgi:hypothetical protein
MALHTGEVERRGGHYVGAPLYRCARPTATDHGGLTVLSDTTEALARDAPRPGATLPTRRVRRCRKRWSSG